MKGKKRNSKSNEDVHDIKKDDSIIYDSAKICDHSLYNYKKLKSQLNSENRRINKYE